MGKKSEPRLEAEPTNSEILDAIHTFAGDVDRRFDGVDKRLSSLENDVGVLKATMVTKDYLDEKLVRFKVGLKNSALKVSRQVMKMADMLHKGGVLTAEQVLEIRAE